MAEPSQSSDASLEELVVPLESYRNAFEEVVPPSTSGSSNYSEPIRRWDVFINHRGPDTKDTLATSIYDTLKRMGLEVFLDQRALDPGDLIPARIQQAMESSSLHIAILSPRYAESPWCLAELAFMLQTGKHIIPVFYEVDPSNIHWTAEGKGIYASAFSKHEKSNRYSSDKLEEWKSAVGDVSYRTGHYIVEKNDCDEGQDKLLEAIKDYILKHVKKDIPLWMENYLVGLDEILQDFQKTVFDSSENIKIIGITGMGGSGKTTLAKKFYNEKRLAIYKCSFIDKIREVSKENLHKVQNRMLEDLGFSDDIKRMLKSMLKDPDFSDGRKRMIKDLGFSDDIKKMLKYLGFSDDSKISSDDINRMLKDHDFSDDNKISSVEIGKSILARRLRSVKVFVILDDVDDEYQLESLLPIKDSQRQGNMIVGQGSVIVVTSRESKVLTSWGISSIYKMNQLNPEQAMELFCCHAFRQPSPKEGFENLVQEFLKNCQGLPLSLKVFGGLVHGESKACWASTLEKVSRVLPEGIKKILKVSFDALDREEKEIFLDICCFFIGEEEELAVTVCDGSGWSGLHSLQRLKNKCLVELDENKRITMHDHLRDMGREIAKNGKEMEYKTPYRLWSSEQIGNIEIEGDGGLLNRGIRGIRAETKEFFEKIMKLVEHVTGSDKWFKRQLEILVLHDHCCTEELAALSEGLVWFRSYFFSDRALPSWLPSKKLRILDLRGDSKLEELWSETADLPDQLRELKVVDEGDGDTRFMVVPRSIGHLQHLKTITFSLNIEGLPEEFCGLQSLEYLDLSGCGGLKSLPSDFGNLKNLRYLDLSFTELKMLPASFKHLINLQYLFLNDCYNLTSQMDDFENITKLEVIQSELAENLTWLPAQIANQKSLEELLVEDLKELPDNIGEMTNLEELSIKRSLLKILPPSIGNLSSLTRLEFSSSELETLPPSIGNLSSLTRLAIDCEKLETLPPSIGNLSSLTYLRICADELKSLPEALTQLTSLQELILGSCRSLIELDILSGTCCSSSLRNLKSIEIGWSSVSRISISQQCCPRLEYVKISFNYQLIEIDSLPISVKTIELIESVKLKSISAVCGLENLKKLVLINRGEELQEVPNFEKLVALKELRITDNVKWLKMIKGLEYCASLERLMVDTRWKEPVIKSLEGVERLETVEVLAWNFSAVEPCLKTIKKWPSECAICARAGSGVEAALKSWSFPGLTLVDSCEGKTTLECGLLGSNAAVMMLFVINGGYIRLISGGFSDLKLEGGKWVWIGVFRQSSPADFPKYRTKIELRTSPNTEDMGMAMMGEEERVVDAFYQILHYLGKTWHH